MDVEDAARVDLGVGDDLADADLAVVVHVVEVEGEDGLDAAVHARLGDQKIDGGTREDLAAQGQLGPFMAGVVKVDDIEAVEDVHPVLVLGGDELLDAVGVIAEPNVDLRSDLAAKLRVERRVDGNLLRVGEVEVERRHPPLDEPDAAAGEQVEDLGGVVEDGDLEVGKAADASGKPGSEGTVGRGGTRPRGVLDRAGDVLEAGTPRPAARSA